MQIFYTFYLPKVQILKIFIQKEQILSKFSQKSSNQNCSKKKCKFGHFSSPETENEGEIFSQFFLPQGKNFFFGRILLTYSRLLPNGFVVTETKWPCRMSFPINIMILHARFRHQHFSGLNSFKRETNLNFVSKFFLERTFSAIFCKVSTSIVQSTSMLPW